MARIGVSYETIKHTAVKLLSQGAAPSVQKIREVLGTGSNTTIAEHLKTWRKEYASKEIHHLPANMPKELISAIEVLWQTAMEQAAQQLSSVKHDLTESQEKLRLDRVAMEKTESEFRARLADFQRSADEKVTQIQKLQTELAIVDEKLKQQVAENKSTKDQHELRLQRAYDDKNIEVDNNQKLKADVDQLKQNLNEQTEKYQIMLNEERALQEESEKRWIKLIDEARTEAKNQRKKFEITIDKQAKQIDKHLSLLSELQHKQVAQQSLIEQKNNRITELYNQCNQVQEKYQDASATIAVLQERLNQLNSKSKKLKSTKQLKAVKQA